MSQHRNNYYTNGEGKEISISAHEDGGYIEICLRPSDKRATILRIDPSEWTEDDLRAIVYDFAACIELFCAPIEIEIEEDE